MSKNPLRKSRRQQSQRISKLNKNRVVMYIPKVNRIWVMFVTMVLSSCIAFGLYILFS